MKIAVLGGSFNPIHIGHLALADEVCTSLGYDKVLFIPTYIPPHKVMKDSLPSATRLELVRKACSGDQRFEAEDCEIQRQGVSYTYDTICYLEEKFSDCLEGKIGLIMGDDLLAGFHLWHRAKDISEKCDIIIANRPFLQESVAFSNKANGDYAKVKFEDNLDFDVSSEPLFANSIRLQNPQLPISSTDIRTRCFEGRAFRYLVPSSVFDYIMKENLYGCKN